MASIYDLSQEEITKLASLASDAKQTAYCPYSNFRVGAALLLDTGAYHTGGNVEVASTPVGTCAERCAIGPVVASFKRPAMPVIRGLAVSTDINPPSSPCGMCRQFIREFCAGEMKVWMYGRDWDEKNGKLEGKEGQKEEGKEGECVVMTVEELLPFSFGKASMDKREKKTDVTSQ